MMEATMINVKEKLANARNLCPGMSKDMYVLTDYMAENAKDELVPMGMIMLTACVQDDLKNCRNGFGREFPEELRARKDFILDEIRWIPQVVDAIAEEAFAEEFRKAWEEIFHSVPPKRLNTKEIGISEVYPAYIKVAVDWWANAIISPKFDNGDTLPAFLSFLMAGNQKSYTEDEIKVFKETLAQEIEKEMKRYGGRCSLDVDYHPCRALATAGEKIGVNDMTGYPCKTYMHISEECVEVSAGYRAPYETLWSK